MPDILSTESRATRSGAASSFRIRSSLPPWTADPKSGLPISRPMVLAMCGGLASWLIHYRWAMCLVACAGCAMPIIPSHRHFEPHSQRLPHRVKSPSVTTDCESCGERQRLKDYARRTLPYVAGPFLHGPGVDSPDAAPTLRPPHSKFHPVPTRPVFDASLVSFPHMDSSYELLPTPDPRSTQPVSAPWHPELGSPPRHWEDATESQPSRLPPELETLPIPME